VTTYPTPPGRIGQAAAVTEVLEHLGSLQAWLGQRRENWTRWRRRSSRPDGRPS
jgi:hypothetical protein